MNSTGICAIVAAVVVLTVSVACAIRRRRVPSACGTKQDGGAPTCDISRFQEYIEMYEKRYLAYQIGEAAVRCGQGFDGVAAIRAEFGKELLPPPYEAQGWLFAKGVSVADIVRMQAEWIRRNGGNPEVSPAAREIERIVGGRCREKVEKLVLQRGLLRKEG